jgi:hypothetical protein
VTNEIKSLIDLPLVLILGQYGFDIRKSKADAIKSGLTELSLEYKDTGVTVDFLLESSLFLRVVRINGDTTPDSDIQREILDVLGTLKVELYRNILPEETDVSESRSNDVGDRTLQ